MLTPVYLQALSDPKGWSIYLVENLKTRNMIKEELNYLDIALRIAGFSVDKRDVELIFQIKELIDEKKGGVSLEDIDSLKDKVEEKWIEIDKKVAEAHRP